MAFRLPATARAEALASHIGEPFDPRGRGKPMSDWVQLPAGQQDLWPRYAQLACDFVNSEAAALKETLIDGLVEARRAILFEATELTPEQQQTPFVGSWGILELLAHLAGWDETNLAAVEAILSGKRPAFWQEYDKDWAKYNTQLVTTYWQRTVAAAITLQTGTHRRLVDYLQSVPADDYLRHKSIATLLKAEASDEREHACQIRAFREPSITTRPKR